MSAATNFRHITDRGGESFDRPALASILAGTKWYRGTIVVGHGSRMMAYPTGGFNSAVTATAGGPLQVAGADADGGLRLIAKRPNVRFQMLLAGAGTAVTSIVVVDGGSTQDIVVRANLSATADTVTYAMRGNAEVSDLVDVAFTGTGAGIVAAFGSATAVPFVRLLGLANGDVDNSASVADVNVDNVNDYPYTVRRGVLGLEIDAAMSLPGPKFVTDNQTITENYAALLLPIHCDEIDDRLGYCLFE